MTKWRVRIRKSIEMELEVEADTDYEARELAEDRARATLQEEEPSVEVLSIEHLREEAGKPHENADLYSDLH